MPTLVERYVQTIDAWCYIDQDVNQRSSDANNHDAHLVLGHSLDKCVGDVNQSTTVTSLSSSASITQVRIAASADTVGELASSLVM